MLANMNDLVASQLGIPLGEKCRILDLGCGFGATSAHLQRQFPSASFTGINQNPVQLEAARLRCPAANFICADFQDTQLPDASFDAAFALESACFAEGETKAKLLSEAARLLRPGSKFVVVDGFRKHQNHLPKLVNWLYVKGIAAWGTPGLSSIDSFAEELQTKGFDEVQIKDISWNLAPSLLHIPIVAVRLLIGFWPQKDREQLRYLQALCLTLALSPFKKHFGYFVVTCMKSGVELK